MKQTISNTVEGIKINVLASKVVVSPFHEKTHYCRRYSIRLSYKGNDYRFTFHDSVNAWQNNTPLNKKDVMYCVLSDMGCYESSKDMDDFLYSFGYDNSKADNLYKGYDNGNDLKLYKQGIKTFEACKKTSEKLHELFNNDELEQLQNEYMEY